MSNPGYSTSVTAFLAVWVVGVTFSLISFRLAISGKLWSWGVPSWLITLTVLVGIWQWIWIAPMLSFARHRDRSALYKGFRSGALSFMALQLFAYAVLYLLFRKFTLQ